MEPPLRAAVWGDSSRLQECLKRGKVHTDGTNGSEDTAMRRFWIIAAGILI
jgi:hypothetical protein